MADRKMIVTIEGVRKGSVREAVKTVYRNFYFGMKPERGSNERIVNAFIVVRPKDRHLIVRYRSKKESGMIKLGGNVEHMDFVRSIDPLTARVKRAMNDNKFMTQLKLDEVKETPTSVDFLFVPATETKKSKKANRPAGRG